MPRKNRTEYLKDMMDFFMEEGRVLTRSEYIALGDSAPIPYKLIARVFSGKNYNTVIRLVRRQFPVEWASLGSKPVEEEPVKPVVKPVKKAPSEKKPAKESTLSPLDMLRATKGESSE